MSEIKIFDGTPVYHNDQWCLQVTEETWVRVLGQAAHGVELDARYDASPDTPWLLFIDELIPRDPKNMYRFKVTMEKL